MRVEGCAPLGVGGEEFGDVLLVVLCLLAVCRIMAGLTEIDVAVVDQIEGFVEDVLTIVVYYQVRHFEYEREHYQQADNHCCCPNGRCGTLGTPQGDECYAARQHGHQHQRHYHTHGSFYGHECFVEWPHHQFATQQEAVVRHIQRQPGFRQQQECIQDCRSGHGCAFGEQSYQKVKDTYGQGFPRGHYQVIHQCMDPYTGLERALTQHKELDHLEDCQPQQVYTHNGQIACQRLFETPGCRVGLLRGK